MKTREPKESKGFLQRVFDFNAGIAARLEKRSDKYIDNAWTNLGDTCEQLSKLHLLKATDAFADAFIDGWAGWGNKVAILPFAIARGTTKLVAKAAHRPLVVPPPRP